MCDLTGLSLRPDEICSLAAAVDSALHTAKPQPMAHLVSPVTLPAYEFSAFPENSILLLRQGVALESGGRSDG